MTVISCWDLFLFNSPRMGEPEDAPSPLSPPIKGGDKKEKGPVMKLSLFIDSRGMIECPLLGLINFKYQSKETK